MSGWNASGCDAPGWAIDAIPILSDNYAWALSDGAQAIVVDPGESEPVVSWLDRRALRLTAILLTHHHPDHVGGARALRDRWPDAEVHGPHDDRIAEVSHRVAQGDRIAPGDNSLCLDVIETPGHTSTHVAYHGHGLLFCGDTLFSAGCGRLFEGTPAQMLASLDALSALPGNTLVCCGHEYTASNCAFAVEADPDNAALRAYRSHVIAVRANGEPSLPSRLSDELAINPFLRIDTPGVRETLIRNRSLPRLANRVDAFAALRTWKDHYRA